MAGRLAGGKLVLFAALLLVSAAVVLAACGGDDDEEAEAPAAAVADVEAEAPAAAVADVTAGLRACGAGDAVPAARSPRDSEGVLLERPVADCKYTLAWSFPDLNIPFFISQHFGVTAECETIGVDCVILNAGGYDRPENQVADMEDLIALGVNAIMIDASDDLALKGVMDDAARAGIVVISWTVPSAAELIHATNGTNHYDVGLLMGEAMMNVLGPNGGDIIVVNGPKGPTWSTGRWDGFEDAVAAAGYTDKLNIVALQWTDSSRAGSQAAFEDMFLANPVIDAVLVCCDQPALGVADVLEEAAQAQGGIPIVTGGGWDSEEEARIRDGSIAIAVVQQPVLDAVQSVRMAVFILNGESIPFSIPSPVIEVTAENVDSVDQEFFSHPSDYNP